MRQKQRLFFWVILLLGFSLLLVGCERPVPESEDTSQETTTDTDAGSEATTATQAEEPDTTTDADVTSEEPTETVEESTEDSTPRVDAEEEASAETTESAETAETSTETEESTEVESTEMAEEAATETEAATEEEMAASSEAESSEETVETAATPTTHTVAAGETLYRIGLKYNVSWVTLAEFNNLDNADRIKTGQVLKIPGETAASVEPTPSPLTETTYTVKAGDNLYRIGLVYNISWVQIAEANGLVSPNQIIVGQVLKIPVDTPGPPPQFTHDVKAGESLLLIATQYGVPWPAIAEANNISSPYVIYPGQTLVIPGG
jgi:LysM repeat protein